MLLVAAVTLAVGWGSAFPTLLTLAADWSPSDRYGTTMAMMSAFFALGTAVGAMAVGYVADVWGFGAAFLMVGGLVAVALGIFLSEYRRRGLPLMARAGGS
jgi:predicted MFS family arabinose efflux permease